MTCDWRAPYRPGQPVELDNGGVLHIGCIGCVDGGFDELTIIAMSDAGFWGAWRRDLGIGFIVDPKTGEQLPSPAGFFCALRDGM